MKQPSFSFGHGLCHRRYWTVHVTSVTLCLACWAAFADDTVQDGAADAVVQQNAEPLLQTPNFISTADGQIRIFGSFYKVESLSSSELATGKEMVRRALAKYPIRLIKANVDCIYLQRTLCEKRDGAWEEIAGYADHRSIFLAQRTRYDALFREAVFHHELCHLLQRAYDTRFTREAWLTYNRDGFSYLKGAGDSPDLVLKYLADGFLCSYGKNAYEEDMCTYAMWLFTRSDSLLKLASQYPRVQAKADLLSAFYESIDPLFTADYFRNNCRLSLPPKDRDQLKALTAGLSSNPNKAEAYSRRACLNNNLRLYVEAVFDANAALSIDPNYGYGYFVRGFAYSHQHMYPEAVDDFNQALSNGLSRPFLADALAHAQQELKKSERRENVSKHGTSSD